MTESNPAGAFAQLLAVEMTALKQTGKAKRFRAGEVIFQQGDPGDGVYVVEDGMVEISALMPGDQRRVLSHLGPGAFFGEMAVLDLQSRSATATATVDSRLLFIASSEMGTVLERSPQLLMALVREFSMRMRQIDQRFLDEILQAERLSLVGRFAQSIVHDFKNPLNMIGLAADLAAGDDTPSEMRSEAKDIIRKQVDRLANMTNELLEFTRGAGGMGTRDRVHFGAFIHDALREIRPEAEGRNVHLECEGEPPAVTLALDRKRLLHVMFNLINNAIDMMPEGGKVILRFICGDEEVTTEIEDTGPGIAPEIAGRLFEPFTTHGKTHGTGLGLSICRRIIEDHKGRIVARSEEGRGAIFSFSLPRGE